MSSNYTPLFQIVCKQAFYKIGSLSKIELIPIPETDNLMKKNDLRVKITNDQIQGWQSNTTLDSLGSEEKLELHFFLLIHDSQFWQITDLAPISPSEIFTFSNNNGKNIDEVLLLHSGEVVDEDCIEQKEEQLSYPKNCLGLVSLEWDLAKATEKGSIDSLQAEIRFKNRAVKCRYIIMDNNDDGDNSYSIISTNDKIQFSDATDFKMPDGKTAKSLTSINELALAESYEFQLSLEKKSSTNDPLKIDLPYPSPMNIRLEEDGGFVGEMFVYI